VGRQKSIAAKAVQQERPLSPRSAWGFLTRVWSSPRGNVGEVARTTSRRLPACLGFPGASIFILFSIQIRNPLWAMLAMGVASYSNDLAIPGAWGTCKDAGGKYAGALCRPFIDPCTHGAGGAERREPGRGTAHPRRGGSRGAGARPGPMGNRSGRKSRGSLSAWMLGLLLPPARQHQEGRAAGNSRKRKRGRPPERQTRFFLALLSGGILA
jgi:hypothetical protein